MKKITCTILILSILCVLVGCAGGSSGSADSTAETTLAVETEPEIVAFLPDTRQDERVYTEVVSLTPFRLDSTSENLLCCCVTASGEIVWIAIDSVDYMDYFDTKLFMALDGTYSVYTLDILHFSESMRMEGQSLSAEVFAEGLSEELACERILMCDTSVIELAGQNIKREVNYQEYSGSLKAGDPTYLDILKITPKYGTWGSASYVICNCETADGKTYWVRIPDAKYRYLFDSELEMGIVYGVSGYTVAFVEPVRLYGTKGKISEWSKDLTEVIEEHTGLDYSSAKTEQLNSLKCSNQEPVAYDPQVPQYMPVYVDVTSVQPYMFSLGIGSSFVVCKCITSSGTVVYLNISREDYLQNIDPSANFDNAFTYGVTGKYYAEPLRIYGIHRMVSEIYTNKTEIDGSTMLIAFERID